MSIENPSPFKRIIGGKDNTNEDRALVKDDFGVLYKDLSREKHPDELPKNPEELRVFKATNRRIEETVRFYGGEPLKMDEERVHIFPHGYELEAQVEKALGSWDPHTMRLSILRGINVLSTTHSYSHELFHLQSFHSLRLTSDEKPPIYIDRIGFMLTQKGEYDDKLFRYLDEALTEELSKRVTENLIRDGIMESPRNEEIELTVADKLGLDDIFQSVPLEEGGYMIDGYTYRPARKALSSLVYEIVQQNPDLVEEEVLNMFFRAKFQGSLLTIGKLIDKSFGPETFRKLAKASGRSEEAFEQFVDEISKKRIAKAR